MPSNCARVMTVPVLLMSAVLVIAADQEAKNLQETITVTNYI